MHLRRKSPKIGVCGVLRTPHTPIFGIFFIELRKSYIIWEKSNFLENLRQYHLDHEKFDFFTPQRISTAP